MSTVPPPMPTDSALLILTQWLSPAYPTGAFAWSHGVEAAVAAGWVRDAPTLEGWLADILTDGSGRSDAVYIALAHAAQNARAVRQAAIHGLARVGALARKHRHVADAVVEARAVPGALPGGVAGSDWPKWKPRAQRLS